MILFFSCSFNVVRGMMRARCSVACVVCGGGVAEKDAGRKKGRFDVFLSLTMFGVGQWWSTVHMRMIGLKCALFLEHGY